MKTPLFTLVYTPLLNPVNQFGSIIFYFLLTFACPLISYLYKNTKIAKAAQEDPTFAFPLLLFRSYFDHNTTKAKAAKAAPEEFYLK